MKLRQAWDELEKGWGEARIRVVLEEPERTDRAAQLLGPLQPFRAAPNALSFRVAGSGDIAGRLLQRLDDEHIHGKLEVLRLDPAPERAPEAPTPTLRESWAAAVATLPADWSDLLAEVELESSDWLDQAAVNMVPINPRRDGTRLAYRFRCARTFGYGGSPEMVARSLARCDEDGMRGTVRVLQALSDTDPVYTQGPVWQIRGQTV